ncbi:MAG: penicillin acylase family protein [Candidatus Acidiferrales bacterium]
MTRNRLTLQFDGPDCYQLLSVRGAILRRAIRYILVALVLVLFGSAGTAWWLVHRSLPQVDGTIQLAGLKGEVIIRRDALGVPHIAAQSQEDLFIAQGYVMAQDRLWQMDVVRRAAAGRLAEIVGPLGVNLDRNFRMLGLAQAADRDATLLDADERKILEAYARGVNLYIDGHRNRLPIEFTLLRYEPDPWRPADTLLVVGYMYQTLTSTWRAELARLDASNRLGKERAAFAFNDDSPYQHPIVGVSAPPAKKASRPVARAIQSVAPASSAQTPFVQSGEIDSTNSPPGANDWNGAKGILDEFDGEVRAVFGSNNWVVDGSHTASGKPLLANDTHLAFGVPDIWYMIHLTVGDWNADGFTLPGAPGIVIGHNNSIAWGFTNDGADVQDLYEETFNPADYTQYRVNGQWTPAQVRHENILIKGESPVPLTVRVTRHGPVVSPQGNKGYALRWTATEPGGLAHSYFKIQFANNWQEFRENLRDAFGPGQNIVYADKAGHIGFIVAAKIPIRNCAEWPPAGSPLPENFPCGAAPMPGENGEFEWRGYIPFDELPQVLDPPGGIIATANSQVAGHGYPYYLSAFLAPPWRTDRIYQLLSQPKKFAPADFAAIQADATQEFNLILAKALVKATTNAKPLEERASKLIGMLSNWDGRMTPDSIEATFLDQVALAFGHNLLQPYFGPATTNGGEIFMERILRERPAIWLPPNFNNYDELLMASADSAVGELTTSMKTSDISAWRWGDRNKVFMAHPLGQSGAFARIFSLGPSEHSGGPGCINATGRSEGPSMRLVADLSDWDKSFMEITTGESGQLGSEHYSDQYPSWLAGKPLSAPFSDAAVQRATVHTMRLQPVGH